MDVGGGQQREDGRSGHIHVTHWFGNDIMIGHELVGRCVAVLEDSLEHRDCFQFSQFTYINLGVHFVYAFTKELGKVSATEGLHLTQTAPRSCHNRTLAPPVVRDPTDKVSRPSPSGTMLEMGGNDMLIGLTLT
jgi:hypothetical protein